jgi:multidrug efflux pump subunit AcrA (membrane-fusion protein)
VLVIPSSAVERVGQLEFVGAIKDGNAERRFVQTGRRWGDQVEVLAGLSAGDEILVTQETRSRQE